MAIEDVATNTMHLHLSIGDKIDKSIIKSGKIIIFKCKDSHNCLETPNNSM